MLSVWTSTKTTKIRTNKKQIHLYLQSKLYIDSLKWLIYLLGFSFSWHIALSTDIVVPSSPSTRSALDTWGDSSCLWYVQWVEPPLKCQRICNLGTAMGQKRQRHLQEQLPPLFFLGHRARFVSYDWSLSQKYFQKIPSYRN